MSPEPCRSLGRHCSLNTERDNVNCFSVCQTDISFTSNTGFTNEKIQTEEVIIQTCPDNKESIVGLSPGVSDSKITVSATDTLFSLWGEGDSGCPVWVTVALRIVLSLLFYRGIKTISIDLIAYVK